MDIVENLGIEKVKERFFDPYMKETFEGLFPTDSPKNIRFAINFLTQIGLGELTYYFIYILVIIYVNY